MLIKSGLLTQMSGSIGGMTGSHNKGGMYLRSRAIPVNPNTPTQLAVRTAMNQLVTDWVETLTQAERDSWDVYAQNVTVTNALGDATKISGQNWYVSLNSVRVRNGLDLVTTAPAVFDSATLNPISAAFTNGTPADVVLTFDDTQAWVDDPQSALIVQASRPQNQSKMFFKGPFQQAGLVLGDATTPPTTGVNVTTPFAYGLDNKGFARVRLSLSDGRLSAPQIVPMQVNI